MNHFPEDTNELRRELASAAERMAGLKRELMRRHREQQKAQTAELSAELDALFAEPKEPAPPAPERRVTERRQGCGRRMSNTGGVPWNRDYNRRIPEVKWFVGRRGRKDRRSNP